MFDLKRALNSALQTHPEDELTDLYTPWGQELDPDQVLREYPRPQMRRKTYLNLNGYWDYAITPYAASQNPPLSYDGKILVPFSPEALLSGVGRQLLPDQMLTYHRAIELPKAEGKRIILHFEAVDFSCKCFINSHYVGEHVGGYDPFAFDITDYLQVADHAALSVADIVLSVIDPSETGVQPRGKQRLDRGSIWYTAQSGIWQTVWIEEVPESSIQDLAIHADPDKKQLSVEAVLQGPVPADAQVTIQLYEGDVLLGEASGSADGHTQVTLSLEDKALRFWSPSDPYLYDLRITYGEDAVESYCAFRSFTTESLSGRYEGRQVFCCNHEPLFLRGILDQGYWPDGLLTAPSDEALIYDIQLAKQLGFNMMRKHLKVESARWYYHCDRLGMIVCQDMVNGGSHYSNFYTSQLPTLFPQVARHMNDTRKLDRFGSEDPAARCFWIEGAKRTMQTLRNHPCIAIWTVFNEGWGQFCAQAMTAELEKIDDSRPFDQASGWFDQGGGNFVSIHNYFRTLTVPTPRDAGDIRAPFISECGGYALFVPEHSSLDRAYGYAQCESKLDFTHKVGECLYQLEDLKDGGLAGYVYTQLSDVEEEVNGLVTYNRRVVKFDRPGAIASSEEPDPGFRKAAQ